MAAEKLVEVWRGPFEESAHWGHAVIVDETGQIEAAWGAPDALIFPRSSCKMIQALPLLESGAAAGLSQAQLALSCASHNGAPIHTERVARWLSDLGLGEDDLRCGPQVPGDTEAAEGLVREGRSPCRVHNNCSGKHTGFLTLNRHLGGGADYHLVDHPIQRAILAATQEVTGEDSPGHGIDGCSAPNFATTVLGLGRAMAKFACATQAGDTRARAMVALREAMAAHPDLVAGEGRACTALMRAAPGVAVKTGAEAVFIAILPAQRKGIAVKITDGATRASEAVIAALLVRCGALAAEHPVARQYTHGPLRNWDGLEVGHLRVSPGVIG